MADDPHHRPASATTHRSTGPTTSEHRRASPSHHVRCSDTPCTRPTIARDRGVAPKLATSAVRIRAASSWLGHSPAAWTVLVAAAYIMIQVFVFGHLEVNRPMILVSCAALALALSARQSGSRVLALIVDWVPLFLVLTAFDFARGAATRLGIGVSYGLEPQLDRALTGTIPTVWLQRHLYATSVHHWWNAFPTLTYFSFYFVTWIVLAVLWGRSRQRFRVYRRRLLALTLIALVVFCLHPSAPPWMDSHRHVIPYIRRTTTFGLRELHLPIAMRVFYAGTATSNQVAALPSLHAAYSTLPLLMFWRRSKPLVRAILVLYPLATAFSLVLMGEHWVTDVLAAWALTTAVALAMPVAERRMKRLHVPRFRRRTTSPSSCSAVEPVTRIIARR